MDDLLTRLSAALGGRYEIDSELGRGGMAVVYRARDVRHDRAVALKVLPPHLASAVSHERFLAEIRLAARLSHPYIVPILDSGEANGLLYYTMPVVGGETLRERLARDGALPIVQARQITAEVAEALAFAHEAGVVHRDVKPSNILLTRDHALLSDFGVARALRGDPGDRLTGTGVIVGTPAYMSPQQALSGELDGRSDQYALGCVAYEMLTGRRPFDGPSPEAILMRHATEPLPPVLATRPDAPEAFAVAVERTLAKDPADRFDRMGDFLAALDAAAGLPPESPGKAPPSGTGGTGLLVQALGVLAFGLAVSLGVWWLAGRPVGEIAIRPCEVIPADSALGTESARKVASWLRTAGFSPTLVSGDDRREMPSVNCEILLTSEDSVTFKVWVFAGDGTETDYREHAIRTTRDLKYLNVDAVGLHIASVLADEDPGTRVARAFYLWRDADRAFEEECFASAESLFEQAYALDRRFVLARIGMANAQRWQLEDTGPPESLGALYQQYAGVLEPRHRLLLSALAGGPPASFDQFEDSVLAILPNDPMARMLYGDELLHRGPLFGRTPEQALAELERAAELDPGFGPAWDHAALLLIRLGREAEARRAIASIPVPSGSCQRFPVADLWRFAWLATFHPESLSAAGAPWNEDAREVGVYARLAVGYFDLPDLQAELGRALRDSFPVDAAAWHIGMNAIAMAEATRGRPGSASTLLRAAADSVPRADQARTRLSSRMWDVVPWALGLDGFARPDSVTVAELDALASTGGVDPLLRARASWALSLLARREPALTRDHSAVLRDLVDEHGLDRRMLDHLEAVDAAKAGELPRALDISDRLVAYDSAGLVDRPFNRAAFYLQRGDWFAALARDAGSDSPYADSAFDAWRWHENVDFEGAPGRDLQAGEIDDALGTYGRLRSASLAFRLEEQATACDEATAVLERWKDAETGLADSGRHAADRIAGQACQRPGS